MGEGRNTMLRRGLCADPLSESVQDRCDSSVVIEEEKKEIGKKYSLQKWHRSEEALAAFSLINFHDWSLFRMTVFGIMFVTPVRVMHSIHVLTVSLSVLDRHCLNALL